MQNLNEMFGEYDKYNKLFKGKYYSDAAADFYGKYSSMFMEMNDEAEERIKRNRDASGDGNSGIGAENTSDGESVISPVTEDEKSHMGIFGVKKDDKLEEIVVAAPKISDKEQDVIDSIASDFVNRSEKLISKNGKHPIAGKMLSVNIFMTMYVFPGIIAVKGKYSVNIAETIAKKWNSTFKNTNLSCSDYDTINSGFRRKCYITTAVCDSLGRPDDCRELNLLRSFRDGYMMGTEDGRDMVRRYYGTAPAIVGKIDTRCDSKAVYRRLYDEYIAPCIALIDEGRPDDCMKHYKKMVESLE